MKNRFQNRNPEKGAALITVLVALMVITLILFEFQYGAMVERKLAYNDLNQTQAYYLAKSGVRFALMRLTLYGRLMGNQQLKTQAQALGGNIQPFLDQIWQLPIPAFPPSKQSVEKLTKADQDAAEKVLKETKIADGQFTQSIRSESSKINLNSLIVPTQFLGDRPNFLAPPTRPDQYTAQMLFNLLETFLKDSKAPYEEFPDLRPEEQVMDIMDWVNPGDIRFFGGSKDSFYERLNPPYKAKKNKFYTVEELRLVRGVNDYLFTKLRPHVTVYSEGSQINLNTASRTLYRVIYPDFTEDDLDRMIKYRDEMGGWVSEAQFVQYVTDNLGRGTFKTIYNDPSKYPFSVGNESFMIESIGKIDKSASSVQRVIRVAVALTGGQGGAVVSSITNSMDCQRNPFSFWDTRSNQCRTKPKSDAECTGMWAGTPTKDQKENSYCKVNTTVGTDQGPAMMVPYVVVAPGSKPSPNALKVLYWSEA